MVRGRIVQFIRDEFETGKIRKELFPMMTHFGIRDYSETVHTVGLNYITAIARHIEGCTSLSEYPVYPGEYSCLNVAEERTVYMGEGAAGSEVRTDSVWYDKRSNQPILISEFERYENNRKKKAKLKEKIQNLLIAYHQLGGNVPVILFVYWSYARVTPGDISSFISILDNGFCSSKGNFMPGINGRKTSYLVYHCIASGTRESLTLNQWIRVR